MHIVILGAGVIGVTTAWQLLKDGHKVTVLDREQGPAAFTSFGNAGLIVPGHAFGWASPKAPIVLLRSIWRGDQSIRVRPKLSLRQWRWIARFIGECTTERASRNTKLKAPLCRFSQEILHDVVKETGLKYDRKEGGIVYFYRTSGGFSAAIEKSKMLNDLGIEQQILSREETVERDPGLARAANQIVGSVFGPTDESGDCHIFTNELAKKCIKAGAEFKYGLNISDIELENGIAKSAIVTEKNGSKSSVNGDAFVLCLGIYSPHLAEKLGLKLPIYPVKGYSMTVPLTHPKEAPQLGGIDEENMLAYCPMGNRLRLTATAEIAGYSNAHKPSDFRVMTERAKSLFGEVADFDNASHWAGLRPMTPTSIPIVDRSPVDNFWLNTGHGSMGWTMSNGSARILADLVGQRKPSHTTEGLRYE